jgi:hypothetical protein
VLRQALARCDLAAPAVEGDGEWPLVSCWGTVLSQVGGTGVEENAEAAVAPAGRSCRLCRVERRVGSLTGWWTPLAVKQALCGAQVAPQAGNPLGPVG